MSDPVTRLNAALEGRYRIERELGEGGMATVYLADDLKHERKVALKVLKPELAAVVGAERFLAEIKTTANLQHPHILPLYDSGEADSLLFYVMPWVPGESLRQRLDREHQLPVDDAVRIATNIAEALDYAHRQGVIHRDIKPANVLLQDGRPVVSDFGIALAVGAAGGGRLTETGLSLGTPHYMSPEQATGEQNVGPATDIYALACVLYEMLVGEPPFTGSTAQAILGKIVMGDADPVTKHRKSVPANVDAVVRKSLEKLPADRFAGSQAFAGALADSRFRHGGRPVVAAGRAPGRWKLLALAFAVISLATTVALFRNLTAPDQAPPVERFVAIADTGEAGSVTLSPDGTTMVYQQPDTSGRWQLWLRRWNNLASVAIPGSFGAFSPAISPDGQEVAFFTSDREIRVVSLDGGIPRTLSDDGWCCMRWGGDGFIYYTFQVPGRRGLKRVAGVGGQGEEIEEIGGALHYQALPDADVAVYQSGSRVVAYRPSTGERKALTDGSRPFVTRSGYLVFGRPGGQLLAAPIDLEIMELVGTPVPIADNVVGGLFWVSASGRLVYWRAEAEVAELAAARRLVWVDRDGQEESLNLEAQQYFYPRISPQGDRIAVAIRDSPDTDLWVVNLDRPVWSKITFGGQNRFFPTWTPDGNQLAYSGGTRRPNTIYLAQVNGGGREPLLELDGLQTPSSWSRRGGGLVYYDTDTEGKKDIWVLPPGGDPEPFLVSPFRDQAPTFSPDGRWLAYMSNKTGENEIYMQPYPGPGPEVPLSIGGGTEPVWAPDGSELFYRSAEELMVVGLEDPLRPDAPQALWIDVFVRNPEVNGGPNYDISADGQRFLMMRRETRRGALIVVSNLFEELKRLVHN